MYGSGVTSALHYLDDFLMFGKPGTSECANNLSRALAICRDLGLPVAEHKVEGPTAVLIFLGIEIDTFREILRLPADKLAKLQDLLQVWPFSEARVYQTRAFTVDWQSQPRGNRCQARSHILKALDRPVDYRERAPPFYQT